MDSSDFICGIIGFFTIGIFLIIVIFAGVKKQEQFKIQNEIYMNLLIENEKLKAKEN